MSFTYDNSLSATKDQLRFLVQDTTDSGHFLEDEEISFISGQEPNLYRAAALLCRTIAAKINKLPGYKDKQIFDPEKKSAEYRALAEQHDLKAESSSGLNISATAIADNISNNFGTSGEPAFTRNLHLGSEDGTAADITPDN